MSASPTAALPVLRIVGPPGSGKTLLITALTEALRERGHFIALCAPRGDASTVLTLSSGARVSIERAPDLDALRPLVRSLDPRAALLLAEGVEAAGVPAIELVPDASARPLTASDDLVATIISGEVVRAFGVSGPSPVATLAATIEARLLRGEPAPGRASHRAGFISRLFGHGG